jgi:hypothetical protein
LIGQVDNPAEARELLGVWIYPFAAIAVTAYWIAGRLALVGCLKFIATRPSSRGLVA